MELNTNNEQRKALKQYFYIHAVREASFLFIIIFPFLIISILLLRECAASILDKLSFTKYNQNAAYETIKLII